MEKKKFKRTLSCLFGGRLKVQFRRKKLGDKVQAKSSNLPRQFCSNSVGTPLDFAAFRRGFDAKYSRASAFSVHNHGFYGVSNTFCQEKHQHFHADRQLVTKKEISIKINSKSTAKRPWPSGLVTGISRQRAGFDTHRKQKFFFLFFFVFFFI